MENFFSDFFSRTEFSHSVQSHGVFLSFGDLVEVEEDFGFEFGSFNLLVVSFESSPAILLTTFFLDEQFIFILVLINIIRVG